MSALHGILKDFKGKLIDTKNVAVGRQNVVCATSCVRVETVGVL